MHKITHILTAKMPISNKIITLASDSNDIFIMISKRSPILLIQLLLALFFSFKAAASERLPFEFTYNGKIYKGFEGVIDGTLKVSVERAVHPDFDEREYTVWFENISDKPSAVLEEVFALKTSFRGSSPMLRGCMGDHNNYYSQYCHDLTKEKEISFSSPWGRATHINFPYFDVVHGDGGTRIALGWAGTWEAKFTSKGSITTVEAKTSIDLKTVLLPGEKIRTGLIVMLDYKGRSEYESVNKWRRWFMKYNLPKADAQGNDLSPFSTVYFAGDTGLPNSDGSISETYFTWQRTLKVLEHEGLVADFRWFDAGWYSDPAGNFVPYDGSWWSTTGAWIPCQKKWPGKTLLESNEACHALGMKCFVWFEPERTNHVDDLVKYHGYKAEWAVTKNGRHITNNIGDPECLNWTLKRIIKMMDENGFDMYREDNNIDPNGHLRLLDEKEEEKTALPRKGISENKFIQGHYALWDGIIAYCRSHGKCTFMDSCASGGGRNDIESMRRAVPVMRSDYDRTSIAMRLQQSSGFNKWIPFHGSSTKETVGQLDNPSLAPDLYTVRASLLPIWNESGAWSHNPDINFGELRRNRAVWKQNSHLLTKDFYELSEWHDRTNTALWTIFAYNDPETRESILLGFRQETCPDAENIVKLPFVDPSVNYLIKDDDSQKETVIKGSVLANGVSLTLEKPKTSLLWHISPVSTTKSAD